MKTSPFRGFGHLLSILFCSFLFLSASAQCPGVNAQVTNGSMINLCQGGSYVLQAQTNPVYQSYQWQKQNTAGGFFENISGANTSSYSNDMLGAYRVVVSNGSCYDTSSITSVVKINLEGGTITGGISNMICADSYVGSLTGPTVPGDEIGIITYQWQEKIGNGTFNNIALANGREFNVGYVKTTTTFRRMVADNCGNVAYSNEITFTTIPLILPGTLQPASQTIMAGNNPQTITSLVDPVGTGSLTYKWQTSLSANGPWENIAGATASTLQPGPLQVTSYFRRTTSSNVCNYSSTTEPVLIVIQNPVILNPGVLYSDNSCLFLGNTPYPIATKVKPVGGVLPYVIEWEAKTITGNWTIIPGENGDKLFPGPITESTSYRKKVTDAAGTIAYTEPAFLSVISTPLIPGEIASNAKVACLGSSPSLIFSVKSGANFGERGSYQWQVKTDNTNWTNITGATRGDFQPQPLTEKSLFRRVFYDSCGPNSRMAISNEVEIDTKPALFAGEINPSTQLVIPGNVPKQLISTTNPYGGTNSYTIWWEKADLAVGPWTKVPGANGVNYQPPATTKTTYYRRVVKDNNCLAEKYSFIIEVFVPVFSPITGGSLAGSTCVFPGFAPKILTTGSTGVSGGYGAYKYQWEQRSGSAVFTAITGAVSENYQPPVLSQTTEFRRKVTDELGNTSYSDVLTVQYITTSLKPGLIAVTNANVCAGNPPGIIKSIEDASGFGTEGHYQWQQKTLSGVYTDIPGAQSKDYAPAAMTQTMYFRRAFVDKCSGASRTGYSNEVMIKATPAAILLPGLINAPFITCAGTAPGTIKSVLDACGSCNLKYQWEVNTGSGYTAIAGAESASYTPGVITANTKYRRKITDGTGATAYSNEVEILVYPPISAGIIGSDSQTVCADALPAPIGLVTECHYTDGTVSYQWQSAPSPSGPWTDIANAVAPVYQPGSASVTSYYRLRVSSTTCSAVVYTNTVVIMVNPPCVTTISSSASGFSNCIPVKPLTLSYPVLPCNADFIYEWEYFSIATGTWKGTGIGTNNFEINSYFHPNEAVIKWRLKMTNVVCNRVTYSNTLPVLQFNCRLITPVIFPNPSTGGIITIKANENQLKVSVMTVDGKNVDFKIISSARGLMRLQYPVSLPSGTYVIHISNVDGSWVEKILIKHK